MIAEELVVNLKEIFIHIGFHKTGTTFLQQRIFPYLKNVNYLHNGGLINLVGSHKKVLISNEALSGIPYHRNEKSYYDQFCFNITQLKSTFGNFNLILGFREPSSMVNSLYKQYLHEGGILTFEKFYGNHTESIVKETDLYFLKFYSYLLENFEKERLFCYDHKQLLHEPQIVISSLLRFLGQEDGFDSEKNGATKRNVSVPDNLEGFLLGLNKWDNRLKAKFGTGLNNKYTRRHRITPRSLAQYTLPKIFGRKRQRNLEEIKIKYAPDWDKLATQIKIRQC